MATLADFRAKFLEFAKVDDSVVQGALDEAAIFIGSNLPAASNYDLAHMYLAAHFLAVSKASASAAGREVISETIGRLSRTFARSTNAGTIGDLKTTFYGARYLALKNLGNPNLKSVPLSHGYKTWTGC